MMTQVTVEAAEAGTSIRDVGREDAKMLKEVVEALPEAGQEAAQLEEPQPQQDRLIEPVVKAEQWAVMPLPFV
jgi:hypothetical protein